MIVRRLTGRRRFAVLQVKSQGAGSDSSVVILIHVNQEVHFIFQNIYMYTLYCEILYFVSHHKPY